MYVEVRHGIYMCSKIWKNWKHAQAKFVGASSGKKTVSLQFFAWICEKKLQSSSDHLWQKSGYYSREHRLNIDYIIAIYIYAKSTKYYIIHITILLYYSSYYTILYKYYFITKYHIYIYIIIHISYPADRNCAPKRRNNAYFGVIRSCLICVDSASDDFGPF